MANFTSQARFGLSTSLIFLAFSNCQQPNITVSLDGSGNYTSIAAAIDVAPKNSKTTFVIYVKEGTYYEDVFVTKSHIIMLGDGINKTIITYNKSYEGGFHTQDTATMDVTTSWFLAKDLSIVNSAGPKGGQAVALRIAGDQIACYRCSIEGYQDTLFLAYGEHHFFYECNIFGTIDFIFGDSSVVFQNTFVYVRKPSTGPENVIIADGRESKEKDSAIVIHNCTINAASDLIPFKSTVKTYLGRPWKEYSRTIIMESYLGDLIDPEGWSKWNDSTFALTTLYYAEYANRGPGASVDGRVKWPGYHILHNPSEVQNFTVQNFIRGSEWLPQLGVPFIPDLIG